MRRLKLWEKLVLAALGLGVLGTATWRQLAHRSGPADLAIIYTADTNGYLEGCG